MVDVADLSRVTTLYAEVDVIERAIANFEAGGMIIQMAVAPPPPVPPPAPPDLPGPPPEPPVFLSTVIVDTHNIMYPPQMKDAIVQQLRQRRGVIDQELSELGVTGITQEPAPLATETRPRPHRPG